MRILRRICKLVQNSDRLVCDEEAGFGAEWDAEIGYEKLEPRKVLSATFLFDGGLLVLGDFDSGQDLSFSQVDSGGDSAFVFEIDNGEFIESGIPNSEIENEFGTLTVPVSLISEGISIDGNNSIGIVQASGTQDFSAPSLELANFQLVDQSLNVNSLGAVTLRDVSVDDTDPNDLSEVEISVQALSISINGDVANLSTSPNAESEYVAVEDIRLEGATLASTTGDVSLLAAEQISLVEEGSFSSSVLAQNEADIVLSAESIFMDGTSLIEASSGDISLTAEGSGFAEITVGRIATEGEISVSTIGALVDGSSDELANFVANQLNIVADTIGSSDDIETLTNQISFSASQVAQITDLDDGLIVNSISNAGSGFLISNGPLVIEADINLTGSFSLVANDSSDTSDTIRILGSTISLVAAADESIELFAGDDIVFEMGSIETSGGGSHTVLLTADRETDLDSLRGSVANLQGTTISVATDRLIINSGDGIGEPGNGLRTSVDILQAVNTFDSDIVIAEASGLVVEDVDNSGRSFAVSADGFVQIEGNVSASTIHLLTAGDVIQSSGSVIASESIGIVQQAGSLDSFSDVDANNRLDIILDGENRFSVVAASNDFNGGAIVLSTVDDVVIGQSDSFEIAVGVQFPSTAGIVTRFSGSPLTGPADDDSGDILFRSGGSIEITEAVNASNGVSDLRIVANGNISQQANTSVLANELGFRQETIGDVRFGANNSVDVLAGFNANGVTEFADLGEGRIGDVSEQTIGVVTFSSTSGFTGDDLLITSSNSLRIESNLTSNGNILLIANGDITQAATGIIRASQLGVRQEADVFDVVGDVDSNNRFDILLTESNDVDVLAAFNAFDSGAIAFSSIGHLAIDRIEFSADGAFAETVGVETTFTGTTVSGIADSDDADVLIQVGGRLDISQPVVAGRGIADIRLIARGDISQQSAGELVADELGIRQESQLGSIVLDASNQANIVAAVNFSDAGVLALANAGALTIGEIPPQQISNINIQTASGLSTNFSGTPSIGNLDSTEGDVLVVAGGSLVIEQQVNSSNGDTRFVAEGDVFQASGATISANELGIIQASSVFDSQNEVVVDGEYSIQLLAENQVDFVGATNRFEAGDVLLRNTDGLAIDSIVSQSIGSLTFSSTGGLLSENGDVFVQSMQSLDLLARVESSMGSIRLVASGDIHQAADSALVASLVGVRQIGTLLESESDIDGNQRFDVILDGVNEIAQLAAVNAFDGGRVALRNTSSLIIGEVPAASFESGAFLLTTGITTEHTGLVVAGADDNDDGDIVINTSGLLQVDQGINAGFGNADVRITAFGDVAQSIDGVIVGNELGIIQASNTLRVSEDIDVNGSFDIHLRSENQVDHFGSSNRFDGGEIQFNGATGFQVSTITQANIGGVSFEQADGLSSQNGDVTLFADGFLDLASPIEAVDGTVRLSAIGDVFQESGQGIVAAVLGVRQLGDTTVGANDLDGSGRFEIVLDGANEVGSLAAFNTFGQAIIAFNNLVNLEIGSVNAADSGDLTFAETDGLVGGGDILLHSDASISIESSVVANTGSGDVRIQSSGDIVQDAQLPIIADRLAVRQSSDLLVAANDLDLNGSLDVLLNASNSINTFAASNVFGSLTIVNDSTLEIGTIESQMADRLAFQLISGASISGKLIVESESGNIGVDSNVVSAQTAFNSAGAIEVRAAVNSTDVILASVGDVIQTSSGSITSQNLGIRQEGTFVDGSRDLDGNGQLDVVLDADNDVDILAVFNGFNAGVVAFNDIDDLTIGAIGAIDFESGVFDATQGVTAFGDVILESGGFLNLADSVSALDSGVRLLAHGDVVQQPGSIVIASELAIRQQGNFSAGATTDFDGSGTFDIQLYSENLVDVFAASNPVGDVYFSNNSDLLIGSFAAQTVGDIVFPTTTGVVAGNDVGIQVESGNLVVEQTVTGSNILFQSTGSISIEADISASIVRLAGGGDITQSNLGVIESNELGVFQERTSFNTAYDLDGSGSLDVILDAANSTSVFSAQNNFPGGIVAFSNINDTIVGAVSSFAFGDKQFPQVTGVEAQGDVLLESDGTLQIVDVISAATGDSDIRLVAHGEVTQEVDAVIIANRLGVRQVDNSGSAVRLGATNEVNTLSVSNPDGIVNFVNGRSLVVGAIGQQQIGNINFEETLGVDSGASNIQSNGFIRVVNPVVATEVRLIANGDIFQTFSGTITADLLGIRQEATILPDSGLGDIDDNNQFDIILDDENEVGRLAALNAFDRGIVAFANVGNLEVGLVNEFDFDGFVFSQTFGVSSFSDVLISTSGSLELTETIETANDSANVRLIAHGDILQATDAGIVTNQLGVRQESSSFNNSGDIDANGRFDISLNGANSLNEFAALNSLGDVTLANDMGLVVETVGEQNIGMIDFVETGGINAGNNIVLDLANGSLELLQPINGSELVLLDSAGSIFLDTRLSSNDVRLIGNGDIIQSAGSAIESGLLSVRQQGTSFDSFNDIEANESFDIVLDDGNSVEVFSSFNAFDGGFIGFNSLNGFDVGAALAINSSTVAFPETLGVITTSLSPGLGDIFLQSGGFLDIQEPISSGNGNSDLRLIANGDVTQVVLSLIHI